MIQEMIEKVVRREDLTEGEMMSVMNQIMEGDATSAQIGAFITSLRMKGETVDEITGAARIMRRKATKIDARSPVIVDTCGTGGDGMHSFNISTTAAFVVSAAGITVAKHGNRAVSSGCGSADVLESLGVNIGADPDAVESCIHEIGIGFLFAPRLHSAMKNAVGPRREIGIRTVFNMLGPLTNPASATSQLLGVFDPRLTEMFAGVLKNLGTKRAFTVHGFDGLDEATVTAETRVTELNDGVIATYNINPFTFFGELYSPEDLKGGTAAENAEMTRDVLSGGNGARRKVVLLNASLAVMTAGKADTIQDGITIAEECIDSGAAAKKLADLVELTNS